MNRWTIGILVGLVGALSCKGGTQQAASPKDLWVITSPSGQVKGPLRIEVVFSQPMVAEADIGPTDNPPLKISPAVEGKAQWTDDRTLVFVADEELPGGTEFKASVPAGVTALGGYRLKDDHSFAFSSARLAAEIQVVGQDKFARKLQKIALRFNQRVGFNELAKHCRYVAGKETRTLAPDGGEMGPGKALTVIPSKPLTLDTEWTFECTAALRGSEGSLGLADKISKNFRTYGALAFDGADPLGDDIEPDPGQRFTFEFSNPIAEPYAIKISPAVRGFPEQCYSTGFQTPGLSCNLDLEPQTKYTITVGAEQKDIFGQELGASKVVSFKTTDARPGVSIDNGYFVAELRRPIVPVWARNANTLEVSAVEVTPKNFSKVRGFIDWWESEPADFSDAKGLERRTTRLNISGTKNKWGQHALDPARLFGKKKGPGMYYVEVGAPGVDQYPFEGGGKQKLLVNFTDIGVVSKISTTRGMIWVTKLSTGKPLAGANVVVQNSRGKVTWSGRTGRDGVVSLPGLKKLTQASQRNRTVEEEEEEDNYWSPINVFVSHKRDFTMINARKSGGLSAWNFNVSTDYSTAETRLRGFMHTDRGLYRPGEKVHVKGIARESRLGSQLKVPRKKNVKVEVRGPRGKTFQETEATLSPFGGFWFDLDLPGDARLGDYTITAKLPGGRFYRRFAVEEFRPATFEVKGSSSSKRVVHRGRVEASVEAKYLYGAPLRSGKVDFAVYQRPRTVRFKDYAGFYFGDQRGDTRYYDANDYSQDLVTEDSVKIDSNGKASVSIDVGPADMRNDADLLVTASVASPANEVISKSFTIPYFRSKQYFGIKSPAYFLEIGKRQTFELVNVAPDGRSQSGEAKLTIQRRDWNCVWEDWGYRGSYKCKEIKQVVASEQIRFAAGRPTKYSFTPRGGGEYFVILEQGKDKRSTAKRLYAWGSDGGSWRSDDGMTFELVADKEVYRAGDTANLILKTDLAKAKGLVTIERDGVIERRFIDVTPKNKKVSIPLKANHAPNIYVSVALVQGRIGKGRRGMPRMKMGMISLPVQPKDNKLKVTIETDEKDYRPGAEVTAKVKVTDYRGRPVAAEVALTAADEGVLSLINYKTPNPVPTFFAPWGLGVTTASQFAFIRNIPGPGATRPATGGDTASASPGSVRSRFMSTAVWKPGVVTNSRGIGTVTFKAPDNLTAFRVMAVASDRTYRFGSGDMRFTVSKPLQLHRALPRFATTGDQFQGGVIIHNETNKAGTATIKLQTNGAVASMTSKTQTLTIPAGGRVPALWTLSGAGIGKAEMTFAVSMNGEKDAVRYEIPVHHPSPERKTLVKHGETKSSETIRVTMPPTAIPGTAMVSVSVDPNGLAGIEEGLRELIGYPYGCLEQTTSQVIPMIAVRGLVESLNLTGLSRSDIDKYVNAGIAKIGRHQTAYGGFALWPGSEPERYYTAYALWGLHLAKKAGYKVDQGRIDDALRYLRRRDSKKTGDYRSYTGDLGSQAFALYVRAMLGDKDTSAATTLWSKRDQLPIYGRAFLTRAMAAGLGKKQSSVKSMIADLSQTADDAASKGKLIDEPKGKELNYYMSDSLRTTAIVLDALVDLDPKNPAIPGLAKAIMKKRRSSRWHTTQSNLYGLIALSSYADNSQATPPNVSINLGGKSLLSGKLSGKTRLRVVSGKLNASGDSVSISTKGTVHYNVEVRYRERAKELKEESNGLTVKREYLNEAGKKQTKFKVGDVVTVRLTVTGVGRKPHLMVSDRMPAGFEALNTRFATTTKAAKKQRYYWGGTRELRDERVDFATEYNWRETYQREYQMRAIATGSFAIPPTVAELMYEPEVNARTGLGQLTITK